MNAIAFDHASLTISGKSILTDISFEIAEGEFVGVLGANGAGKTTVLKAILGLLPLDSGAIRVLEKTVTRGNPAIGYLPQSHSIQPGLQLCGRDLLLASIRGHRWGLPIAVAADRREVDRCLEIVGAEHLAGRRLSDMSGGERQRLLIAETLIGTPRLLLLDEPLISLDPHQQMVIVDLVRDLSHELNLTVLFCAHELNQVLGAIDKVLYLGHGNAAIGPVDTVVQPETLSRLYGASIDVVRAAGRIFIMSGGQIVERDQHHDHVH